MLQEIFYFKPQTIYVSQVFLTVIAYVLGEGMTYAIPWNGKIGRFLNPGPFNAKEHAAVALMASAASQSALATEALAAQQLFYGGYPSHAAGVFITLYSQLISYGIAGLVRDIIVRAVKMLWPMTLPISSLLESLHRHKKESQARLKIFYVVFAVLFFWTIVPEVSMFVGVYFQAKNINAAHSTFSRFWKVSQSFALPTNIVCFLQIYLVAHLGKRDWDSVSTSMDAYPISFYISSGRGQGHGNQMKHSDANERFPVSFCFDWNYVASLGSPLWFPLYSLTNSFIGYIGCIILFLGVYYANIFNSQNFPFLSQLLFHGDSNSTYYHTYNQSAILNPDFTINETLLHEQGIPWLTGCYLCYLITSNMGLTATFTHMLLWNFDDIKAGWSWASPSAMKKWFKLETYKFWANQETPEQRLERKLNENITVYFVIQSTVAL